LIKLDLATQLKHPF